MMLTDLTDTYFNFECETEDRYWDYSLVATVHDYKYYQSLNSCDVENLRENCKRILAATEGC